MSFFPFLRLFLGLKWRLAGNQVRRMRRYMYVHLSVGLMILLMLVGGGTAMFSLVFDFLMGQEVFGRPLMDRLVRMVLLAFFSMLVFSNLIIMLTTTYISREVEFLMALPIRHRHLFFAKLLESIVYSSWAFVILSFPFFVSMGRSREITDWTYYFWTAVLVVPFLVIPAALGAGLALVVTAWFPPRKMIRLAIALATVGLVGAALMQRFYGVSRMMTRGPNSDELARVMRFMGVGDGLWLPSSWLGRGLLAAERGEIGETLLWAAALWTTAALGLVACDWLAGPLYYGGWCNARTSGSAAARRPRWGGLAGVLDRLLGWLPRPTRALVVKDVTIFWRDPAQWGQLVILFGLLFIYLANLRSTVGLGGSEAALAPFWQAVISMFNIGATCFVLSILTTRFVYPMLSLEGRQQWAIGLAPMPRTQLVWIKFMLSWVTALGLTLPLALLSAWMLHAERFIYLLSAVTVGAPAGGRRARPVGLGATLPNFGEDNPSRIANGVGGTLNAVLSLIYIGLTLALEAPWVYLHIKGDGVPALLVPASVAAWVALQAAMLAVPMTIGLARWRRIEF